jgi:hypothetical protein
MATTQPPLNPPEPSVREEIAKIRNEIQQAKLDRAEKHATYMRNWLAILTVTVTVTFVGFGILGYTRYSDIQTYRTQMATEAKEVSDEASSVSVNAKKVTETAGAVNEVMGGLKDKVEDLRSRMKDIEARYQKAEAQFTGAINRTNAIAQQTRFDVQTSLSSSALGLGFPAISSVTLAGRSGRSMIEGFNFGEKQGSVYFSFVGGLSGSNTFAQLTSINSLQGVRLQPTSIKKWENTVIEFEFAPEDIVEINKIAPNYDQTSIALGLGSSLQSSVTVRVVTQEGVPSISSYSPWLKPQ